MMIRNNEEAIRVLLQEGDPDIEHTIFVDVNELSASKDSDYVTTEQETEVLVLLRWVRMLFYVWSTVIKSCELKAMLKTCSMSRDGRAAYLRMLEKLDTTYHGAVGRSVVLQDFPTRLLVAKSDPAVMFDESQSLPRCLYACMYAMCAKIMYAMDATSGVATPHAIRVGRKIRCTTDLLRRSMISIVLPNEALVCLLPQGPQ